MADVLDGKPVSLGTSEEEEVETRPMLPSKLLVRSVVVALAGIVLKIDVVAVVFEDDEIVDDATVSEARSERSVSLAEPPSEVVDNIPILSSKLVVRSVALELAGTLKLDVVAGSELFDAEEIVENASVFEAASVIPSEEPISEAEELCLDVVETMPMLLSKLLVRSLVVALAAKLELEGEDVSPLAVASSVLLDVERVFKSLSLLDVVSGADCAASVSLADVSSPEVLDTIPTLSSRLLVRSVEVALGGAVIVLSSEDDDWALIVTSEEVALAVDDMLEKDPDVDGVPSDSVGSVDD